ncbi:hypothetical protein [Halobacillus naozhouensis]|uniref:Gas vesicle protein n=1 Tax=Halobacillus naozhouensis TaxID=554880 RepID=A0ABY8IX95_9BACI|nr:hypothetical protein [Halobacillus naozhouensis]WFT74849.1 hypothetical protein P9989_21380 [Halobacillus naozhouensis]
MTQQTQVQAKPLKGKLTLAMTAGAIIGGALVLVRNPTERTRLKERSGATKDSLSQYVSKVKEDPSGTKEELVSRIQRTTSVTKEAINKIQEILDNEGKELKEKVQEVKADSEEIVSTAKEAGEELKDVNDKVNEAKDEITDSEDNGNLTVVNGDEHEIKKTIKPN